MSENWNKLLMSDLSGVGNFSDTDSEVDIVPRLLGNNSLWLNGLNDSDTDSDDEDFRAGENPGNDANDTDSLTGTTTTVQTTVFFFIICVLFILLD